MASMLSQIDPAWIANAMFLIFGFIAKKALAEIKDMRKDLDDIRLLLAKQYPTKEEVKEIAKAAIATTQSEHFDRYADHFYSRHEGEALKDEVQALWKKVN